MAVVGAIGVHSAGQRFAWRGMSSADYRVASSAHRRLGQDLDEAAVRAAELELLKGARDWGLGVGETAFVDDLQLLADLQHYGIETRLIDFTSNPMTALWFACQTPENPGSGRDVTKSGVLLALNVSGWPKYASVGAGNTWGHAGDPNGFTIDHALKKGEPFIVESSHPNDRLRAQEGFFVTSAVPSGTWPHSLFGGTPFRSLEVPFTVGDPESLQRQLTATRVRGAPQRLPFVGVIIKAGLKLKLLSYLENTYARSPRVLFPDYSGFRDFAAYGGSQANRAP